MKPRLASSGGFTMPGMAPSFQPLGLTHATLSLASFAVSNSSLPLSSAGTAALAAAGSASLALPPPPPPPSDFLPPQPSAATASAIIIVVRMPALHAKARARSTAASPRQLPR
jgi:hypothetical protein